MHGRVLNDHVFISINDHETSEIWLIPAGQATGCTELVAKREPGVQYSLTEAVTASTF